MKKREVLILTNEECYFKERKEMWLLLLGAGILLLAGPIMMYFLGIEMATYDQSALNAGIGAANTFVMVSFLCFLSLFGGCYVLYLSFKKRESWISRGEQILDDRAMRSVPTLA